MLGKLAFIGVAQSAGFKLREIKNLVQSMDGEDGMAGQIRSLSSRKLEEAGTLPAPAFFAPDNVAQIIGQAHTAAPT